MVEDGGNPSQCFLDEFVVMPNHFHGILVITRDAKSNRAGAIGPIAPARGPIAPTHGPNVSADGQMMFANGPITHASETAGNGISSTNRSGRPRLLSNSLGAIVGQFKSVTTKRIRKSGFNSFKWQRNYWDQIIRNQAQLNRIRQYILANPANWNRDIHH